MTSAPDADDAWAGAHYPETVPAWKRAFWLLVVIGCLAAPIALFIYGVGVLLP